MMLLLDIGNSRLKWATWDGHALADSIALEHGGDPAAVIAVLPAMSPAAVWIAQVMGAPHEQNIAGAIQQRFGLAPKLAHSREQYLGFKCAYADASRLGVDRWLMLLAAWREQRGACCVVSAGTALTFDAVDAAGQHLGGFIAPGLAAMLKATLGSTRFATFDLGADYGSGLGDDTEACVRQGAFLACVGAVDRGLSAAGVSGPRFICGGDAATLLPGLGAGWQHRRDLVLEGLLVLARQSA
jgi:type III pantothenate kinase